MFNELVDAQGTAGFKLAQVLDNSHNVTDPIESLMSSAIQVQRAYVQASLADRVAMTRLQAGGAIDPVAFYRVSGYRGKVAAARPKISGAGGGIVQGEISLASSQFEFEMRG